MGADANRDLLDPQVHALLQLIEQRGLPPTHTLAPKEARAMYRDRRFFTQPEAPELHEVRDLEMKSAGGPISLRLYRPAPEQGAPALVYFHGGGWTIGDLDTHDVLCRELARASGCVLVAVDYRLGPEHRFPAAVDDAWAATRWVAQHAAELGIDAARIGVGGDSAGGNLAAVVALMARDAGDLPLAFQLLIYPATDARRQHESHRTNGEGYLLTRDTIEYFHDHYICRASEDLDWRASPLLHEDLSRLPPAFVLVAGFDPLRDEGLDYARRLGEAGNRVSCVNFPRQIHGFITMGRVIDEANAAVAMCAAQMRRVMAPR
jgi:acetyl esterase